MAPALMNCWLAFTGLSFLFLIGVVIFRLYRDGRLPNGSLSGLSFAAALLLILAWPRTVGEGSVTYDLCAELVFIPAARSLSSASGG